MNRAGPAAISVVLAAAALVAGCSRGTARAIAWPIPTASASAERAMCSSLDYQFEEGSAVLVSQKPLPAKVPAPTSFGPPSAACAVEQYFGEWFVVAFWPTAIPAAKITAYIAALHAHGFNNDSSTAAPPDVSLTPPSGITVSTSGGILNLVGLDIEPALPTKPTTEIVFVAADTVDPHADPTTPSGLAGQQAGRASVGEVISTINGPGSKIPAVSTISSVCAGSVPQGGYGAHYTLNGKDVTVAPKAFNKDQFISGCVVGVRDYFAHH